MAKQTINLGTMADNKSGDPLRTAFQKVNDNFTELYDRPISNGSATVSDNTTDVASVTDFVFQGATVSEIEPGMVQVSIDQPTPQSTGVVTFDGANIIGGRVGAAGTLLSIGTNHNGDQPGCNGTSVTVDPNFQGIEQVTDGWIVRLATGEVRTLVAAYHWNQNGDNFWVLQWDQNYLSVDPVYPLTVESPDYQVGEPTHLVLSSGTTAPGAAIDIKEEEVTVNFSGFGVSYRLTPNSITLPSGMTIAHQSQQTITTGGFIIQPSDLAGATVGWGAPQINADNIVTNGWDYVQFANQGWYDYLYNLLGGQFGGVAVTWADGSQEITSNIYVQFTGPDSFQFVPSNDAGGSSIAGTWYFPLNIGAVTTTIPAAMVQSVNDVTWTYGENGSTILPGSLIESVAQIPDGDRIVDISKSVVVVDDGNTWTLPDGTDGQRLSFVPATNAYKQNIWLSGNIASWQYNPNTQDLTAASVGSGWWINPFMNWGEDLSNSQFQSRTLVDAVWVNGAWHFQGGVFD